MGQTAQLAMNGSDEEGEERPANTVLFFPQGFNEAVGLSSARSTSSKEGTTGNSRRITMNRA
jgi:hypothetical protein